jgi:hypothetical protein
MRLYLAVLSAIVVLLGAQTSGACAAPPKCLDYGGEMVALTGKLHRATFPGRPDYESIADGDEPETGFYLTLAAPEAWQRGATERKNFRRHLGPSSCKRFAGSGRAFKFAPQLAMILASLITT